MAEFVKWASSGKAESGFSHIPDSEEAKLAHEKAEEWAVEHKVKIIEIPDGKSEVICKELPNSYNGDFDESLRRN